MLPFGNGRSYGDVCLNPKGTAVMTRGLDRFMSFDAATGRFVCEAGMLLSDILAHIVPTGWFLPVVPGTRYVTLGGAVGNDVHGKNHHTAGSFGCHVRRFELLRSDGERIICSADENSDYFAATIGGLGLTGLILWVEVQLLPIPGARMNVETVGFRTLGEFTLLSSTYAGADEYTVAWLDLTKGRAAREEGVFLSGKHAAGAAPAASKRPLPVPLTPPLSLVDSLSTAVINRLYRTKADKKFTESQEKFFFPLDGIGGWTRLYGPRGFYQYQCVIPQEAGIEPIRDMLKTVDRDGIYSFLAVLKTFGARMSPGMLSFPCAGVTLSIDVPNGGDNTLRFFDRLDAIVMAAGGRLYPAKDVRMPARVFKAGFPQWQRFAEFVDPHFSSAFWRRVTEDA